MDDHKFKKEFISQMLGLNQPPFSERRKSEDLMQSVLAVLLEYNSEYAKGIEELIKAGLDQNDILLELKEKTEAMRVLLLGLSESCVDLNALVRELNEEQKEFIKHSFKSVYEYIGVTSDGTPHKPVDGLLVSIKQALQHRLLYVIAGMVLIKFLPLVLSGLGIK